MPAGGITYTLRNFTMGNTYTIRLHFAELVYNTANARQMNVRINGVNVLTNFDIFAAAGAQNRACVQEFTAVADSAGKITIALTAVTGSCCINGIEVLKSPTVPGDVVPGDVPLSGWAEGMTPTDSGGAGGAGPSSADSVNLASGVYENNPGAEIGARNPVGPSPVFARSYRSKNAAIGYSSPGLPLGWTHNYDVTVQANYGPYGPLTLRYPNGATEEWASGLPIEGHHFLGAPAGAPYTLAGVPASGKLGWQTLTMTFKDESRWTFTPAPSAAVFLLTQITNLAGRSILLNYTSSNILSSITDDSHLIDPNVPANTLLSFNYGANSLLTEVFENSDPANPRHIVYSYTNSYGTFNVSQIARTAVASPPLQWQYNGSPLLSVRVPDPSGATPDLIGNAISYDANKRVKNITDANGNLHAYTYGDTTQAQTLNGTTTSDTFLQKFDILTRDTGTIDAINNQTSAFYEDSSNPYQPTRLVNRNGQTALMTYDSDGSLLSTDVPCPDGRLTTAYNYDYSDFPLGRLSSVQEGAKTPTSIAYYTNNTVVNIGGISIPQPNGLMRQVTSPRPGVVGATVTTTYVYTALGNVLTITLPGPNGQVTYTYNYTSDGAYTKSEALGEPLTVTDPLGHTTHYRYDGRGNLSAVMDAIGRETDYTYNDTDQLILVKYPPKGSTSPGRSYVKYTYLYPGGSLQKTEFFDETGALVRSVLRTAGKEDEDKKQSGSTEQATLAYDPAYRLKTLTDGNNHSFSHSYDLKGNLTQFAHPLANTVYAGWDTLQGTYDNEDNLTQLTDGRNQIFKYSLAPDDSRLTDVQYPPNTFHPADSLGTTHYDYDAYGRVVHRSEKVGSFDFAYDDLDNVLAATSSYGGTPLVVSYTYNPDGSRNSMTTPAGTYNYHYDDAGRMTSVSFPWGQTVSYTYDNANRFTSQQQSKFTTTYTYDGLDNLLDLNQFANNTNQTPLAHFSGMSYDAVGNRQTMTMQIVPCNGRDASGYSSWVYDTISKQSQLTSEGISHFNLPGPQGQDSGVSDAYMSDAADNLIKIRNSGYLGSYNADNQFTYGSFFDGNGNTYPVGSFEYDVNNRLSAANPNGYNFKATYRDDGLRASKYTYNFSGAYTNTHFLYDGTRVIYETGNGVSYGYGATGLVQSCYSYNNAFHYTAYTFDPMGNTVSRFPQDNALDQPKDVASYDAFGKLRGYYNPDRAGNYDFLPDPVGYGGQWGNYTDVETDLVLMTYRYYDPIACRFLTRDPQGYDGGINLYAYVRNNPINRFDPSGLGDDPDDDLDAQSMHPFASTYPGALQRINKGAKIANKVLKFAGESNPIAQAYEVGTGKRATEVNQTVPLWERALSIGVYAATAGGLRAFRKSP